MTTSTRSAVGAEMGYPALSRLFHWATLALIMAAFGLAWGLDLIPKEQRSPYIDLHRWIGLLVLALVPLRLLARWILGSPALPTGTPYWQRISASLLQYGLYALMIAVPLLGVLYSNAAKVTIRPFELFTLPALIEPASRETYRMFRGYHALGSNLILFGVGFHAAAALFHHFILRDGVLLSMLTGRVGREDRAR